MKMLGLVEGPVHDVVKVVMKYQRSPQDYMLALRTVTYYDKFKFVIDQDECLYLRFDSVRDAEMQCVCHRLILNKLVKFYKVETVRQIELRLDRSRLHKVWSIDANQNEGPYNWQLWE